MGVPAPNTPESEAECAFEAGLRRDLLSAPLLAYKSCVGGWRKRAFDIGVVVFLAPAWLIGLFVAAAVAVARNGAEALRSEERVGYGGRTFTLRWLNLSRRLRAQAETDAPGAIASLAETADAKWRHVVERLPQMFDVLLGRMSLVGPTPLTRTQLEALRGPWRYYLSALPGVVGLGAIAGADRESTPLYRAYAQTWSWGNDVLIMWDAANGLRNRGRLWASSEARDP